MARSSSPPPSSGAAAGVFWSASQVTAEERARRHGHAGRIVWLTGLSGAGKSTLARALERRLFDAGREVTLLDGDNLRHGLCSDLDFSAASRSENIRRAAAVARLFADAGLICVAAFISPLREDRARARALAEGRFLEVHVDAPVSVCRRRDPKGLYARADRGEIPSFTGVSAPYERPLQPEVVVHTDRETVEACVTKILAALGA